MPRIPFFNYPALFQRQEDELLDVIRTVLREGRMILQAELESFERHLAAFVGVRHAIGVGNGTDALHLALRAAGLAAGDEVILPSHTFVATASAVHFAGGKPVLVDIGEDHLIDPDAVRAALTPRTRFLMPVHLNGRTSRMDELQSIADEFGLRIIEDAAQGLGSSFRGRKAGSFGVAAGFSFYPAKLLGCFGDGGAVVTDDDDVAARLRLLRNHGRGAGGEVMMFGVNSRLDNLQAAILGFRLNGFADEIARRREIASSYDRLLGGIEELRLPPAPDSYADHFDVYQNYEIEAVDRDRLRRHLASRGIETVVQWGGWAVHQFAQLGLTATLPVCERVMRDSLLLPMHTALSNDDVSAVADAVAAYYVGGKVHA